jgi:hypothetical protein
MDIQIQEVTAFIPNFRRQCETCGDSPTVDVAIGHGATRQVVRGRVALCGVCTWGESAMRNYRLWNL